ncbi:MAG: hypothetical protein HY744_34185 [Deltaproteobacteria bacterium]|nr:hypothetical protein [Deltaproteobacteria bacterium]
MARTLDALFREPAFGPLAEADRLLAAGEVVQALQAVSRERLIAGLRQGIQSLARAAGVAALALYQRLPMAEVEADVERLESSQADALAQWRAHATAAAEPAPALGGPPRALSEARPDERLLLLADVLAEQEQLGRALRHLAGALEEWHQDVAGCQLLLLDPGDLRRRYRRRLHVRALAVVLATMLAGGALVWLTERQRARARIDATLSQGGCAAQSIASRDLAYASETQRSAVATERHACQEQREAARRAAEQRRQAELERQAEQRLERLRLARCARLGEHFRQAALDPTDDETAGRHAALLRRLADGRVEAADVAAEPGELPCAPTPTGPLLGLAYAQAVVGSPGAWLTQSVPSAGVRRLLVEHRSSLAPAALAELGRRIEYKATRAVRTGARHDVERYSALCELKTALGLDHLATCTVVLSLAKKP